MTAINPGLPGAASSLELLRLATIGGRSDRLRIALTIVGSALGTVIALFGVAVASIQPGNGPYSINLIDEVGLRPGVIVALLALLAPIVLFVGLCTRVGAPARDRRLAMFRMAGATPNQATKIASFETSFAAFLGGLLGLAIFLAGRFMLDEGPLVGSAERTFPTDASIPLVAFVAVVAVLTLGALGSASLATRKVRISPFGVTRSQNTDPPTTRAVTMFLLGSAGLIAAGVILRGSPTLYEQAFALFALGAFVCFMLCAGGLLLGSASFAYVAGKFFAPRASRADLLIASRRMLAAPYTASRTTASVILAALIGSAVQGARAAFLTSAQPAGTPFDEEDLAFYKDSFDLLNVVLIVAILVATASLLVTASEAIVERRRTLATLVASGTPRSVVARAAMLESLIPLVPAVALATVSGWLFARNFFGSRVETWDESAVPPVGYNPVPIPWVELLVLGGGVIAASVIANLISLAFLSASTRPTELRTAA